MRNILILLVFAAFSSISAMPSEAHYAIGRTAATLSLSNPSIAAATIPGEINLAKGSLSANRAMDLNEIVVFSDTPTLADSTALEDSVDGSWSDQLTSEFGDIGSMILNWLENTAWPWIESEIGGGISSGVSSIGGTIESWGDDVASWFGTRHRGGGGFSTLTTPTTDTSVVFSDGMGTKGILIGSSLGLLANSNGGTVIVAPTLTQNTTYTIPDPGTTSANFVLDQGNQSFGGNRTFSGNVTINSLTASQAVATDPNKKLISLGYGSTNTANTLVERDGSGNFSAGAIMATHVLSSGSVQTATYDGTIVTNATASGSDVSGTINLTTASSAGEGTVTVPFASAYTGTPVVVVTPATVNAQQGGHITGYYVSPSSGNFILNVKDDGTGVTSAVFDYIVIH